MSEAALDTAFRPAEDHGDVVDARIRALIDDYVRLAGATLENLEPNLLRLTVAPADRDAFRGRHEHLLALDLTTLDRHANAELPVIGSAFWESLIAAVRRRGMRRVAGPIPITVTAESAVPDVAIDRAAIELAGTQRELRRIVRVTARVTVAAGTTVHEDVIQGEPIDLTNGRELPASVLPLLDAPDDGQAPGDLALAPSSPTDRLVPGLIHGLEAKVARRVESLHAQSARDLAAELDRIDRYYEAVKQEVIDASGPDTAAVRTVEREHEKRRAEEVRRHDVRVSVEPLQMLERAIVVERATWRLVSGSGTTAELSAQRYLSGDGDWGIHCDVCRSQPESITVCRAGHAVGTECTRECCVCREPFCTDHGYAGCAIDDAPVCADHSTECWSCERVHCTQHQGTCAEGDHAACVECLVECGSCSRTVCRRHVTPTDERSPRGARVLCSSCVVFCEGATGEPIGRDEAASCGTCGLFICETHQVCCVVDAQPHCSKHLRRSDRSRRFVCAEHIASCDRESPDVVFTADEVHRCVECACVSCNSHGAACQADGRWHCREHLVVLNDLADALGCAQHHSVCHIDGRTFSLEGTSPCEVCARASCRTHTGTCNWCGGRVCVAEMSGARCATCANLAPAADIPDDVIAAIVRRSGEERAKGRLIARDGTRFVVQLDLGWTRRLVLSVPHEAAEPSRIMRHSLLGSREVR